MRAKKVVKVLLVVLMLIGAAVATSNVFDTELHSAPGKWVKYIPEPANCKGEGKTCYDMTAPEPN